MCNLRLQLVVSLGRRLLRSMTAQLTSRRWVKMPAVSSATATTLPKYSIDADAFVIYRDTSAYVSFEDEAAEDQLTHHEDVRVLSESEAREFERTLPFQLPELDTHRNRVTGLGDLVSALARLVGIRECSGCRRRKTRMNKIPIWGWWSRA
jgi:hypothetical protein